MESFAFLGCTRGKGSWDSLLFLGSTDLWAVQEETQSGREAWVAKGSFKWRGEVLVQLFFMIKWEWQTDLMDYGTKVNIGSSDWMPQLDQGFLCRDSLTFHPGVEFLCGVWLPHCHNGAVISCSHDVSIRGCLIQISIAVVFIRIACHTASRGSLPSFV